MRQSALIAALVASAYALDNGVGPLGFHDQLQEDVFHTHAHIKG